MEKGYSDKVSDPEAAAPASRITFQAGERPPGAGRNGHRDSTGGGRPDTAGCSRSRVRSLSRDSGRRTAAPYAGLPIEYRTLSIHVSESRNVDTDAQVTKELGEDYFSNLTYHELQGDQVCQLLNVNPDTGLSEDQASTRLQRDGKNELPNIKTSYIRKILEYLFGGFCSVLWIGAIIFFLCWQPLSTPPSTQNLSLAVLIIIVIFLQAGFSAFQDWSAAKTMNSIFALLPSTSLVRRDGHLKKLPPATLVAGDMVLLKTGDKVPADIRLLNHSGDIRFDRAVLTGESEEVEGTVLATDPNFLESRNIALMGTTVLNGSGEGIVVLTGARSVIGRIAYSTVKVKKQSTLIQREINRFVCIIVCLTVVLALLILFTWVGWLRVKHPEFLNVPTMLVNVMACVVAFIPEGMPIAVALTLMMVARRMKAVNVLPKSLATVETLGCVNVICSDKTGTLTRGDMFVNSVAFLDQEFGSPEDFYRDLTTDGQLSLAASSLLRAATLCNDATFDVTSMHLPVNQRAVIGNATDKAILRFSSLNSSKETPEPRSPVLEIPFNSKNKWMLTLVEPTGMFPDARQYHAFVKGAPDVLLPGCTQYWSAATNTVHPLTTEARASFHKIQDELSSRAERVLVLCEKSMRPVAARNTDAFRPEITNNVVSDLTIIGMLGIIDPPREEALETVRQCRQAGARFFMVTGDYALTASAIARSIGVFTGDRNPDGVGDLHTVRAVETTPGKDSKQSKEPDIITRGLLLEGDSIGKLTDSDWDVVCDYEEIVFARTTPEQKLRIVTEFRARHYVVAVTGDGVNDAPALRAADVGVAVVTGSDVAIEAADLILLDQFDSIVDAIRLGRLVFQNLQKCIAYLLPAGSWSEIWPVILNVFFGVPLPLNAFLMIIICVFTDLFLSLSLVMEKEEFDLLARPPRNHRRHHLIDMKIYGQAYLFTGFMETITAHSMFFLYMWKYAKMPISDLFFLFENYTEGYHGYTQAELVNFNVTGQCVYFVTLVFLQWGNILSIRNRRLSIIEADPIREKRRNPWLLLSMLISLVIAVFVTEVPGIQTLFGTASVPIEFWLIPIPLGFGILSMDETRKLIVRTFPKSLIARAAW